MKDEKLASGELSEKKGLQAWFKRHKWLAAILAALGLASVFSLRFRYPLHHASVLTMWLLG